MASSRQGEVSVFVDAPPEAVWSLVADLERMGEWSPECYQVGWLDGARSPARPGARFRGRNRWGLLRWSMTCEVKTADPSHEISWSTVQRGREVTRWTYRLEPEGTGTTVTESFDALWFPPLVRFFEDVAMRNRDAMREAGMRATLDRIKAAAEAGTRAGAAG